MEFKRGKLSNEQLIHLYKSLLLPRMIEDKMLLLLRQGKISKWFSGIGQEAIAVGATLAMDPTEWIMPLHRNLGVFTSRNMPLVDLFKQWQGYKSGYTGIAGGQFLDLKFEKLQVSKDSIVDMQNKKTSGEIYPFK